MADAAGAGAGPPTKLVRGLATKVRLAIACGVVLIAGALLAPRSPRRAPPPSEKVAPMLQAEVERREPARVFRGVQDAGRKALHHSVALPAVDVLVPSQADFARVERVHRRPSGFGILVTADGWVLTHVFALDGRMEPALQLSDGTVLPSRVTAYEPETGLVLLQVAGPSVPEPPALAAESPAAGELAVAAAHIDGHDFVAPIFIASSGSERYTISAASGVVVPGIPIYNLSGEAVALAAGSPWTTVAFAIGPAVGRLGALAGSGRGLPRSLGLFFQARTPVLARILGEGGALIADVAEGSPAARAGLRAGDVLVRLGESTVAGVEDAQRAIADLSPGASSVAVFRRSAREREVEVQAEAALVPPPDSRGGPEPPRDAPPAEALFPPPVLARAAVPRGAVVLAIDGFPVTRAADAAALLKRRRPPWLVWLQLGSRRFLAGLEPPP